MSDIEDNKEISENIETKNAVNGDENFLTTKNFTATIFDESIPKKYRFEEEYDKPNYEVLRENILYEMQDTLKRSKSKSDLNDDISKLEEELLEASNNLLPDSVEYQSMNNKSSFTDVPNKYNKSCIMRYFDKISGGSLRGGIFAVASMTFGGGCLAFPAAVSKSGLLLGFIIYFFAALTSYITSIYIVDTGIRLKILDYNELVRQACGDKMVVFADINNILLSIGVIMGYQYIAYDSCLIVFNQLFGWDVDNNTTKIIIIIVSMCIIQIPLSCVKNISTLQYASLLATVSLTYIILVVLFESPFYFMQNYGKSDLYVISIFPPQGIGWNWLNTLSTFLFGFCVHNGFFQVFMEMDRPNLRRSMKVTNRATLMEVILYAIISLGGFFSVFYDCPDAFIKRKNLDSFENDYFMLVGRIFLVVVLNSCMAINYNVLRIALRSMVFKNEQPKFIIDFSIVVAVYIITNVLVYFAKDVSVILGFFGGLNATVISFVCPILIKLGLSERVKKGSNTRSMRIFNYIFLVVIIILGLACTAKSVIDYIGDFSK
jgi:amino acid permease